CAPRIAGFVDHVAAGAVLHRRHFVAGERAHGMVVPVPDPAILVIDRDPKMTAGRMVGTRRDHGDAGHDPLGDAPIILAAVGVSTRSDQEAARALDHLEMGPYIAIVLVALRATVQRVDLQLTAMEP